EPARSGTDRPPEVRPWLGLSSRDRRFYGAVLLVLLLGQLVRGGWLLFDPEVRVSARFWSQWESSAWSRGYDFALSDGTDPWGQPYLGAWHPALSSLEVATAWSNGPNGIDEGGGGDDIT